MSFALYHRAIGLLTSQHVLQFKLWSQIEVFISKPLTHSLTSILGGLWGKQPKFARYLAVFRKLGQFFQLHTKKRPSQVGDVITPPSPWPTSMLVLFCQTRITEFKNLICIDLHHLWVSPGLDYYFSLTYFLQLSCPLFGSVDLALVNQSSLYSGWI